MGVATDLGPEDTVAPSKCGLIACFIKGEPLEEVFRRQLTCAFGLDLADALNIATGAALVNKTKNNGKIAVVFLEGPIRGSIPFPIPFPVCSMPLASTGCPFSLSA